MAAGSHPPTMVRQPNRKNPDPFLLAPLSRPNPNQYAHPDAPKPIHPDKEHFCPSTLKLGAYIQPSVLRSDLCRNRPRQKTETRFPHKRSNADGPRRGPTARPTPHSQHQMVEMDGIEPTTPCLQSRC